MSDDVPQTRADRAGAAAMEAAAELLELEGYEIERMFIALVTDEEGAPNASTSGIGFDDADDLFSYLLQYVKQMGDAMGITVNLVFPDAN